MTAGEIRQYLSELNDERAAQKVKVGICLDGDAVMCLAFKARPAAKDIDAIFLSRSNKFAAPFQKLPKGIT